MPSGPLADLQRLSATTKVLELNNQPTRAELARVALVDAISAGTLRTGELYSVQLLASALNMSRTPVREALLQMARHGQVRFERNRGVRIIEHTPEVIQEIFQIRLWLEVPATRAAVARHGSGFGDELRVQFDRMLAAAERSEDADFNGRDRAFHRVILEASGNARLAEYVDSLRELILRRGATAIAQRSQTLRQAAEAHRPILDAVERGDADGAADAMGAHIARIASLVR